MFNIYGDQYKHFQPLSSCLFVYKISQNILNVAKELEPQCKRT